VLRPGLSQKHAIYYEALEVWLCGDFVGVILLTLRIDTLG
jgi:hypothetical protein